MTVVWDNSLATGSHSVDNQHKELFRQVAAFEDAMKQGKGRDELRKILDFLAKYVVRHFADEEKLMAKVNCPAAAVNKQAHTQFLTTYSNLRKQFDGAGAGPALVLDMYNLLSKWLVQHIKGIDVQLRDCCGNANQNLVGAAN
jgi:hemerythrin